MIDAGMEMSDGHITDMFDVKCTDGDDMATQRGVEREGRMKEWLCVRLDAGSRAPFRMSNKPGA